MSEFNHKEFLIHSGLIVVDTDGPIVEAVNYNSAYLAISVSVLEGAQTLQPILRAITNVFGVDSVKNIDFVGASGDIEAVGDYLYLINTTRNGTPSVADNLASPIPRRWLMRWNLTTGEDCTFDAWIQPIITPGS